MGEVKKFELTSDFIINTVGKKLFRIKSLISFSNVNAGEIGGYIEKEANLSQSGDAWVYGCAEVYGNAMVYGDARVFGYAEVYGSAEVFGNARVYGDAWVYGHARVSGDARVYGDARVFGDAEVYGSARVSGDARVFGYAWVSGNAEVYGDAWVSGHARVYGNADYATIKGFGTEFRCTTFFRCKDGCVRVACGCFYGTIAEFREQVNKTREGKIAKEYLMIADLMEMHFEKEEK